MTSLYQIRTLVPIKLSNCKCHTRIFIIHKMYINFVFPFSSIYNLLWMSDSLFHSAAKMGLVLENHCLKE